MKAWTNVLWFLIGGGIGYFVGDGIRKKIDSREKEEPKKEEKPAHEEKPVVILDRNEEAIIESSRKIRQEMNETAKSMAELAGYSRPPKTEEEKEAEEPDFDKDVAEMELYLASFEHPSEETGEENEDARPEYITVQDYFENESQYEQRSLIYYDEDQVLCDENEEKLENAASVIPREFIPPDETQIQYYNDGEYFFVRNHRLKTDYEIKIMYCSYAHMVMGLEPEGEEREQM